MGSNRLTSASAGPRPAWRRFTRWRSLLFQLVLISLAAVAYFGVRGLTQSSLAVAEDNARDLMRFEDAVGIGVERSLQRALIDHDWVVTLANWVYIYGHWPVIALTLAVLFVRQPPRFRLLRNAMFISGAIGLIVFALYPVAPPRLMDIGIVDTVTEQSRSYRTLQPPGLINKYAALPSLHFGWNLLVGVILWQATRRTAVRVFAVVMPVLMAFAVVVTANHYVIDVVAGGALALLGLFVALRLPPDLAAPLSRRHRRREAR